MAASTNSIKNNGHAPIQNNTKKKRPTIKLTCVGSILLGMYALFLYAVLVTFEKHGVVNDETSVHSMVSFRWSGASKRLGEKNGESNDKIMNNNSPPQEQQQQKQPQISKKTGDKVLFDVEEISTLLTGSMLKNISRYEIRIQRPPPVGSDNNQEEGLRDRRSISDVISTVLSAAQYGDRQYDDNAGDTQGEQSNNNHHNSNNNNNKGGRKDDMPILTAYCESVNQTQWNTKPLPIRDTASSTHLFPIQYPHVQSCRALPSQWPIDTPPTDLDPFLPWIHDVFPRPDGSAVVFVAQNRRRCFNGQRTVRANEALPEEVVSHKGYVHWEPGKNYFMRPQASLFQHVPVKKINADNGNDDLEEPRYRLASHEEADQDGMETRFLCRFKKFHRDDENNPHLSIVGYSLSQFELDYDYHTYRKGYLRTHSEAGYDNHVIWTSQLLFQCPIPPEYRDCVAKGDSVEEDYATLYVDVIPIRTPPRYTPPREFFPPRYNFKAELEGLFVPDVEWGKEHILPKIEDSGRWENIPVCMPSLMTHGIVPKGMDLQLLALPNVKRTDKRRTVDVPMKEAGTKIHKIIACTWASATFKTRGNRAQVGDGKRRLKEWLEFNILAGFDHVYVYDNSGAFTNQDSLADIIDLFPPEKVTRIDWPCKICSNRDGNEGERSSQYAAESSCRLRFGSHAKWLGSFDTDEYLIPMGDFTSMGDVSEYLDRKGMYIAEFKSSPAKPRFDLLDNPKNTEEGSGKFTPTVKVDETFLHTYNCNWEQFPRSNTLTHRSKQMYRADYVKLHYVHYATATVVSQMTEEETIAAGLRWKHKYKEGHLHQFFEVNEATMLHTKSKVAANTQGWQDSCKIPTRSEHGCNLGFPFPIGADPSKEKFNNDGWAYNCFINEKVESYWWQRLVEAIRIRDSGGQPKSAGVEHIFSEK